MSASTSFSTLARSAIAAALLLAGAAALPDRAEARDRFSLSLGFTNWGASSIGIGYSSGGYSAGRWDRRNWGHHNWNHRGWGSRGWNGDRIAFGFSYVVPPAYYGPRYYDSPAYFGTPPYGYPARSYYSSPGYYPAGGVVVFPAYVRDRMDARTRGIYYSAYRDALAAPVGEPINWRDGRISGDVTTTRDGWAGARYCREFRQNIVVDGRTEGAYGTACRNDADTDWEIIPN